VLTTVLPSVHPDPARYEDQETVAGAATGNACPVRAPRSQQVHTALDDLGAPLTAFGR
jgi:hypothetical protein